MPSATLSFHLNHLRQSGLVKCRREGRSLIYTAEYAAMNGLLAYLTENCCQGDPDLAQSFRFYTALFAAQPAATKPDYAKWMLADPRVNFAISMRSVKTGLDHLGIQVETPEELHEVYGRLQQADRPVLEQGATTCCYAQSEKSWITDLPGLSWETFLTSGQVYGDSADVGPIRTTAAASCTPKTPQGTCCAPTAELAADAPCREQGAAA